MTPDRFVILHHLAPTGEHWDFMMEQADSLTTWQMLTEPTGRQACPIACIRIKDHRKTYLDYEGPISGGRGIVTRVDHGRYRILGEDDDGWTIRLRGIRMNGDFRLDRNPSAASDEWTMACS